MLLLHKEWENSEVTCNKLATAVSQSSVSRTNKNPHKLVLEIKKEEHTQTLVCCNHHQNQMIFKILKFFNPLGCNLMHHLIRSNLTKHCRTSNYKLHTQDFFFNGPFLRHSTNFCMAETWGSLHHQLKALLKRPGTCKNVVHFQNMEEPEINVVQHISVRVFLPLKCYSE